MFKLFKSVTMLVLLVGLFFGGCRKAEFDEFYGRPAWLAKPIYQQLDSMGDFKNYLICIDKAGYKTTLGSAGSWTVFAPTDEAFIEFMNENNISDINSIDKELAEKIVRTSMVYDGEKVERLNDNFSQRGWIEDVAFRRRTVYYDFVESGKLPTGKDIKYISTNRITDYVLGDKNNKHLTYFFSSYMNTRGLGQLDYETFYPNSIYTGLNIAGAQISTTKHDIIAENGVIHVVDKVIVPEKNIDQYLTENPQYSIFKSILDLFVTYSYNSGISRQYEVLTGNKDSVFIKGYTQIGAALNNENFTKEDLNDAQINNNSITVPNNASVEDYAKKVLLKYYPAGTTFKQLFESNSDILKEYVNSHIYNTQLWPTNFNTQNNFLGESPKINASNIIEAKLLSNGAFYGINASQKASVFHTVYGNVLLDPKFSLMRQVMEREGLNLALKIPTVRYMLVLIPNSVLYAMGFSYDSYFPTAPIRYNGLDGRVKLLDILRQHIVPLENYAIPDLMNGEGLLESFSGEYIKYKNGKLYSRGTLDSVDVNSQSIQIDSTDIGVSNLTGPQNGIAVYTDGLLSNSNITIGNHLIALGANNDTSPFYDFFRYLKASPDMYTAGTGAITGVAQAVNYTLLIPNNSAMAAARTNGLLPAFPFSGQVNIDKVKNFIKYHIIKNSFAIDGKKTGTFESLYKDLDDVVHVVKVTENTPSNINITDDANKIVTTDYTNSNLLGNRIVIHSLNNYLDYRNN